VRLREQWNGPAACPPNLTTLHSLSLLAGVIF
jgi:hypothetical protein